MNNTNLHTQVKSSRDWHSRGYLPHFDGGQIAQFVTFRLVDSFPETKLRQWADELEVLSLKKAEAERRRRIEEFLDKGMGEQWLSQPPVAEIVERALLFFDGQRYRLHAWVIMPNHVHVLLTPNVNHGLSQILHTWKSFTAKKANKLLQKTGAFWQDEYFDRFVRNERHFDAALSYIENNPVKAGLCLDPIEWHYTSANRRLLL